MSESPYLKISHVADTAQKAPPMNEAMDLLDRAMNQVVLVDCDAGGVITMTDDDAKQNVLYRLTGDPPTAFTLVIPGEQRFFAVHNQTGRTVTVEQSADVTAGTWETAVAGERALFHADGENVIKFASSTPNPEAGTVEAFTGFIELPEEKTYVLDQSAAYAYSIDTLIAETAAGGLSATIAINGTPVGGINGAAFNTTEATATATSGNDVAVGDRVTLVVTDLDTDTAEDFSFTLKTTRS